MIPSNTVPITRQEYLDLASKEAVLVVYKKGLNEWTPHVIGRGVSGFDEIRILEHDYRHYFGEVVNLKDHSYQQDAINLNVNFFDSEFIIHNSGQYFTIYNPNSEQGGSIASGTEAKCKQWLIDYFTAIAAKDLPNLNLKFIFS